MNSINGKVGVVVPTLSDKVHWLENARTVQDVLERVLEKNSFLTPSQLSVYHHGRVAGTFENIPIGDIVQLHVALGDTILCPPQGSFKIVISSSENSSNGNDALPKNPSDRLPRWPIYPDYYSPSRSGSQPPRLERHEQRASPQTPRFETRVGPPVAPRGFSARYASRATIAGRVHRRGVGRIKQKTLNRDRKVLLRFHLFEFGEHTIEQYATNHEPLRVHFNIIKKRLLHLKCLRKDDELDFHWPHLRWIPKGSTRVIDIRIGENKGYGCFVRKRQPAPVRVTSDDENSISTGCSEEEEDTDNRSEATTPPDHEADDELTNGSADHYEPEEDLDIYQEPNLIDEEQIDYQFDERDNRSRSTTYSYSRDYLSTINDPYDGHMPVTSGNVNQATPQDATNDCRDSHDQVESLESRYNDLDLVNYEVD
ncbi:hypothetical protein H072_235 [Dactylellina haptotyla CBS 200.50]|uniref:Ubiquitin-like domain-containing protein n=1 Tax=Dactylellina haptotyla (strain CBS 200.50) TaxID=1284197 RepID=S8ARY0_DACHA|nr:hypothetical protein H072_235 [Dactylellina haptotyla CBS 200.50]